MGTYSLIDHALELLEILTQVGLDPLPHLLSLFSLLGQFGFQLGHTLVERVLESTNTRTQLVFDPVLESCILLTFLLEGLAQQSMVVPKNGQHLTLTHGGFRHLLGRFSSRRADRTRER